MRISKSLVFKTIQGWIYAWLEWTYSKADVSDGFISDILDIYGYFLFIAPIFALIPGLIIKIVKSCTGSQKKGDFYGLVLMFALICFGCVQISGQMCYQVKISSHLY